jgi:UDP-N-acetylmuramoyl-tripeptide--D-alanyl-D-alanine ligase
MRDIVKKIIIATLLLEAKLVIRKYKPKIVAITGSVGKTSTKDAIYSVISSGAHVRKSEKSFNSEIGIPLTILGVPNAWGNPLRWMQNIIDGFFLVILPAKYPEWLVLEVGADRPGDISKLASWLPVDIAVITRLPEVPVHVEFFDSPEAVIEEKASLIGALKPGGTLILFADDVRTESLKTRANGRTVIMFGLAQEADVHVEHIVPIFGQNEYPEGMAAQIRVGVITAPIEIKGAIGTHALLPALAAVAVGSVFKKGLTDMLVSLGKYVPPPGRMRLLRGVKDTLIIDDTYNSSPAAASAALEALAFIGPHFASAKKRRGRRIAVIGDMLELGRHSVEEHRKLGKVAAKNATLLLTVGFRARDIAEGALDHKMKDKSILQYEDAEKAGDELEALIRPGDTILVKGSQGMRLEKVVEMLMANPEQAPDLLVRQDEEWKKR